MTVSKSLKQVNCSLVLTEEANNIYAVTKFNLSLVLPITGSRYLCHHNFN